MLPLVEDWPTWPEVADAYRLRDLSDAELQSHGLSLPPVKSQSCVFVWSEDQNEICLFKRVDPLAALHETMASLLATELDLCMPKTMGYAIPDAIARRSVLDFLQPNFTLSPVYGRHVSPLFAMNPDLMDDRFRCKLAHHMAQTLPLSLFVMNGDWTSHNIMVYETSPYLNGHDESDPGVYSIDFAALIFDDQSPIFRRDGIIGDALEILSSARAPLYSDRVQKTVENVMTLPKKRIKQLIRKAAHQTRMQNVPGVVDYYAARLDESRFGTKKTPGLAAMLSQTALEREAAQYNLSFEPR